MNKFILEAVKQNQKHNNAITHRPKTATAHLFPNANAKLTAESQ